MKRSVTIELLGGLRVCHGGETVARFRTQKTALLLAYLACHLRRQHAREELIELLWPEVDIDAGRTSLRTALASLRRQLEPPGTPVGGILIADRLHVQLNPDLVGTDVLALERAARDAVRIEDPAERARVLSAAADLYRGPLLPGFYDDWALRERERVQALYGEVLRALVVVLGKAGDPGRAIEYAHRLVAADPLNEEAHGDVMRLYAATGQYAAVERQYREMERVFLQELGTGPSTDARALRARLLEARGKEPVDARRASADGSALEKALGARATNEACVGSEGAAAPPAVTDSGTASPDAVRSPAETGPGSAATAGVMPAVDLGDTSWRVTGPAPPLPLQQTRFFGREQELARLEAMLQPGQTQLLTLTGPGGGGKTRLALEAAGRLRDAYRGAVWFVPLTDVTDAEGIKAAIARSLRLALAPDGDPLEQVIDRLSRQRSLLVLDNLEQVANAGTPLIWTLLERAAPLTCLVTSRQRLDIGIERQFPVPPLPVPDMPGGPERLVTFPSVRLFLDRAQAVRPDFQITWNNASAVAALCERLEGLPLALELAAAWAPTLTPAQMLARLDRRFDLLTSRRRDLSPRHRTLRGAIEWSYDLLEPALQRFFLKLSVFRGGWTLDTAEEVCEEPGALEYLQQLRDRSLIAAEESDDAMRFQMLDSVRDYAREKMGPADRDATARRHLLFFRTFAEQSRPYLDGPDQSDWLARMEGEHENFRAALEWAREHADVVEDGLWLAAQLHFFWYVRGYLREGYRWLIDLLFAFDKQSDGPLISAARPAPWADGIMDRLRVRAQAAQGAGELACALGDYPKARELFDQSLAAWREVGDRPGIAYVLNYLGIVLEAEGRREEARLLLEQSLALWTELNDRGGTAHVLKCLGVVARAQGDPERARGLYEEAARLYRASGNRRGITMMLGELARLALAQGDYRRAADMFTEYLLMAQELKDPWHTVEALAGLGQVAGNQGDYPLARDLFRQSIEIARELGHRRGIVAGLNQLGTVEAEQGEYAAARDLFEQGLAAAREMGEKPAIAMLLDSCGCAAAHQGDYRRARALLTESLQLHRELGDRWGIASTLRHLGNVASEENDLPSARSFHEESLAIARDLGDRHGVGMSLYDLGDIARQEGDVARARELLSECLSLDQVLGIKGGAVLGAFARLASDGGDFEEGRRLWMASLAEHREIRDRKGMIECLEGLAGWAAARALRQPGKPADRADAVDMAFATMAARLWGAVESLRASLGSPLPFNRREEQERQLGRLRPALGDTGFRAAWTAGRAMTLDQAIDYALSGPDR